MKKKLTKTDILLKSMITIFYLCFTLELVYIGVVMIGDFQKMHPNLVGIFALGILGGAILSTRSMLAEWGLGYD